MTEERKIKPNNTTYIYINVHVVTYRQTVILHRRRSHFIIAALQPVGHKLLIKRKN